MAVTVKDPDEKLDYTLNFAPALDSDTIASHLIIAPDGIDVESDSHTDTTVTAWLSGGTDGVDYQVVYRATTLGTRVYDRVLTVQVRSASQFIGLGDLTPFTTASDEKLLALIDDFTAMAVSIAPCLGTVDAENPLTAVQVRAVRAVLRGSILRWVESDGGALQQQVAGPFAMTVDTRQQRKGYFWPSEIDTLQSVCSLDVSSGAFYVDTWAAWSTHLPWCSLNFGATYCSCGVDIAGYPIFELEGT